MDLTIQRINSVGGDDTALLNRLMSDALEVWNTRNVLWESGLIKKHQLEKGAYSHRFKLRGKFSDDPEHHSPGQFLIGDTRPNSYVDVDIDRPLVKTEDLDMAEVDMSNYDEVSASVREVTRTVADLLDKRAFRLGILAARSAAVSGVHNGGNIVERTAADIATAYPMSSTGADNFEADLANLGRLLDEDDAPDTGRAAIITPYIRQVLLNSNRIPNRDYTDPSVANISTRIIGTLHGFNLMITPSHMPSTNVTGDLSKYNGNFTVGASSQRGPVCLALVNDMDNPAIGAVVRSDIAVRIWQSEDHMAWRVRAMAHLGMGVVAPYTAGEIGVASS